MTAFSDGDERSDAATLADLRRLGAVLSPRTAFANSLREHLMTHHTAQPLPSTAAVQPMHGLGSSRRLLDVRRPRRIAQWGIATAAILLMAIMGLGQRSDRGAAPASIVAPVAAVSPSPALSSDCQIDAQALATVQAQWTDDYTNLSLTVPLSSRAAPTTGQLLSIVAESDLPQGSTPDRATMNAVRDRWQTEFRCYWPAATVPQIRTITRLPDGRVGVFSDGDAFGYGTEMLFTFAPITGPWGDWIGDSILLVMPDTWLIETAPTPQTSPFPIAFYDVYLSNPTERVIAAGPTGASITVENRGDHAHTLTIPALDLSVTIPPHDEAKLKLPTVSRGYTYRVLDLDDGSDSSTVGKIWVIAPGSATPVAETGSPTP